VASGEGPGGDGFSAELWVRERDRCWVGPSLEQARLRELVADRGVPGAWFGSVEHRMTYKPGRRACAVALVIGSASGDQLAGVGRWKPGREGSPSLVSRVQVGIDAAITSNHHVCVQQVGADDAVTTNRFVVSPTCWVVGVHYPVGGLSGCGGGG
jgi:hypothetical protein